ncbi:MAG: hypothetical protein B7733_19725 [Myxococcales bacterium FL481]|nr:MAG: hypothetical protein B7733_19725 [Myxococcales bacterium FL481]
MNSHLWLSDSRGSWRQVFVCAAAISAGASCQRSPKTAAAPEPEIPSSPTAGPAEAPRVAVTVTGLAPAELAAAHGVAQDSLYMQTIALLRSSDAVVPPALEIHPVTATYNREAIIPPQCYTRTEGRYNPCYVCHQDAVAGRENTMNDADLQEAYTFSDLGFTNHWSNLFEDRSARVAAISDEEILAWIAQDNYSELAGRLEAADFRGWIPDLRDLALGAEAFDEQGFARDGSGWVAFNYKPLPSTFWPTNGSTDDVMIRLPGPFRTTAQGQPSRPIYRANLAILEGQIKQLDRVSVAPLDERLIGKDLNRDGQLGEVAEIVDFDGYVGAAQDYFYQAGVYPLDTEFLHSVRYLGFDADGGITVSRRMKELRYMRKRFMMHTVELAERYREEGYAKDAGQLPGYFDRQAQGLDNGMGWTIQGFIEAPSGRLRANTFEETLFCMGCHTSIGSTIDKTFSFPRKVDGRPGWGYIDLHGMADAPSRGESAGEIATYLSRVGGGGEFRSNPEMQSRFFDASGQLRSDAIAAARDVYELIAPSRERALALNKAYRVIVADQDYIFGRDATVSRPPNVYDVVDPNTAPALPETARYAWDIRLDWTAGR